ncbi:FtsW/RodA/SpoVE family cell cycle protein [Candidatus Shapirobacteria bacterium]|nr:FtsW/RodA/SpoVE family cell cycle protein [Candidatus Shapirobacteria bacterium]
MRKKGIDGWLLGPVIFLTISSLVLLSDIKSDSLKTQAISVAVGFILFFLISFLPPKLLKQVAPFLGSVVFVLLLLPLLFGQRVRGVARWFSLGPFSFQPSEAAKPLAILLVAFLPDFWLPLLVSILISALFFIQPDLGSSLTVLAGCFGVILVRPKAWRPLLAIFVVGLLLSPFFWQILAPFQKERLISFLNPQADPLGSNYQSLQALIAIGSGGFLGRGLGLQIQSRLAFLPEYHNDLIFASLVESFGFMGGVLVLLSYGFLFWHLVDIAFAQTSLFEKGVVFGVFTLLFFQATINIGMNLGLLPITGITLPLLSYGGSSYIATMVSLGLCHSLWRQTSAPAPKEALYISGRG